MSQYRALCGGLCGQSIVPPNRWVSGGRRYVVSFPVMRPSGWVRAFPCLSFSLCVCESAGAWCFYASFRCTAVGPVLGRFRQSLGCLGPNVVFLLTADAQASPKSWAAATIFVRAWATADEYQGGFDQVFGMVHASPAACPALTIGRSQGRCFDARGLHPKPLVHGPMHSSQHGALPMCAMVCPPDAFDMMEEGRFLGTAWGAASSGQLEGGG